MKIQEDLMQEKSKQINKKVKLFRSKMLIRFFYPLVFNTIAKFHVQFIVMIRLNSITKIIFDYSLKKIWGAHIKTHIYIHVMALDNMNSGFKP